MVIYQLVSNVNFLSAFSGFIGTVLIFFFGVSPAINKNGHVNLILEQVDQKEVKKFKFYTYLSRLGLVFIILSFLLQIINIICK